MVALPILMYIAIILIFPTFVGASFFIFYQYELYKLTHYSDTWYPWKFCTFGIFGFEIGIGILGVSLFGGFFFLYPDILNVEAAYIPLFLLIYGFLICSAAGVSWAAFSLRKYWINVKELAIKSKGGSL